MCLYSIYTQFSFTDWNTSYVSLNHGRYTWQCIVTDITSHIFPSLLLSDREREIAYDVTYKWNLKTSNSWKQSRMVVA